MKRRTVIRRSPKRQYIYLSVVKVNLIYYPHLHEYMNDLQVGYYTLISPERNGTFLCIMCRSVQYLEWKRCGYLQRFLGKMGYETTFSLDKGTYSLKRPHVRLKPLLRSFL